MGKYFTISLPPTFATFFADFVKETGVVHDYLKQTVASPKFIRLFCAFQIICREMAILMPKMLRRVLAFPFGDSNAFNAFLF